MGDLTVRQDAFCREYLLDLNGTQAAIRAGYAPKSAQAQASRLLTMPRVLEVVEGLMVQRNTRLQVDADFVLSRLLAIDGLDPLALYEADGSFKPVSEWPLVWRQSVCALDWAMVKNADGGTMLMLKGVKWPDKVRNLELIGKHVSVGAFKDRVEVSGNLALADRMKAARERLG